MIESIQAVCYGETLDLEGMHLPQVNPGRLMKALHEAENLEPTLTPFPRNESDRERHDQGYGTKYCLHKLGEVSGPATVCHSHLGSES